MHAGLLNDRDFTHLVGVPGHAAYVGTHRGHVYLPEFWVGTYPGYRYNDEIPLYVDHIRAGIVAAAEDPHAILVFSGGYTRPVAAFPDGTIPLSEAEGYRRVAEQFDWFNCPFVADACVMEDFARDSYENLEFSCYRFRDHTGSFPKKVTVCGLAFKKARFQYHADIIRRRGEIPSFRFNYLSVNDPPEYILDAGTRLGESQTLEAFKQDPYGDSPGGQLTEKRRDRDTFGRGGYPR